MATDTEWPSEDEDFDAVIDNKSTTTATVPERKSVAIKSDEDSSASPEDNHESEAGEPREALEVSNEPAPEVPEPAPEVPEPPHETSEPPVSSVTSVSSTDKKAPLAHLIAEAVLVMLLAGVGYWAFSQASANKDLTADNKNLKSQVAQLNANPQIAVQKQTNDLISKVSALMQLPAGETPTVASVSDASAAKKQSAFFNNAQNGDKVLMYVKAGEAILYRPSTDKIILVAPLTFSGNAAAAAPTPKTTR